MYRTIISGTSTRAAANATGYTPRSRARRSRRARCRGPVGTSPCRRLRQLREQRREVEADRRLLWRRRELAASAAGGEGGSVLPLDEQRVAAAHAEIERRDLVVTLLAASRASARPRPRAIGSQAHRSHRRRKCPTAAIGTPSSTRLVTPESVPFGQIAIGSARTRSCDRPRHPGVDRRTSPRGRRTWKEVAAGMERAIRGVS